MKEFSFNTRFDLGDEVVGFDTTTNRLVEFQIEKITFDLSVVSLDIWYHAGAKIFHERNIYRSRQEFIDGL